MESSGLLDSSEMRLIPARKGVAARVKAGHTITVINTHGSQVVDTWAFSVDDVGEHMSMEHSRASLLRIIPRVDDCLVTNRRRRILTLVADTTPGIHDTLIAACDTHRYRQLGVIGHHDNCTENLAAALAELNLQCNETPAPLNLFMNVPCGAGGELRFEPPLSKPGQYVKLRAEMDLVIAFSACPQDVTPVNGMTPTDAHFIIG